MSTNPATEQHASLPPARGWWVECTDCHRSFLVTREEIMSGAWLHKPCPHCQDAPDAAETTASADTDAPALLSAPDASGGAS